MDIETLREIEKLAREFICCPYCENGDIKNGYCPKCMNSTTGCNDIYLFADKLQRMIKELEKVKE